MKLVVLPVFWSTASILYILNLIEYNRMDGKTKIRGWQVPCGVWADS